LKVTVLEEEPLRVKVLLEGVERPYANALRRLALSEVPTMAVDDIVVVENSSALYDEILGHRLGLIPLTTPRGKYIHPADCDCRAPLGCSKCRVLLTLDVEGRDGITTVYSGDLKSEDEEVRPYTPNIPILVLAPGQRVKVEAYARLGKGRDHAKWQAATISVLLPHGQGDDDHILMIESAGAMTAKEILISAMEILEARIRRIGDLE
jgi:DNA-directed RNA polymerase subunit D